MMDRCDVGDGCDDLADISHGADAHPDDDGNRPAADRDEPRR